ncbi:MAG: N-acetylmuramoyl-L-alanine amidase [Oscillochloris sp.]|nr:N-acetylmuramoyl-L-alanine amidase [Oscillochloris sp.]
MKRLRDLALSRGMPVLGGGAILGGAEVEGGAEILQGQEPIVVPGDALPPLEYDFQLVQFTPQASAAAPRDGRVVEMVVLHGLPGEESETLARMTAIGATFAVHYYVSIEGVVYQLVDATRAAWHAGFGTLAGTWYNLNRTSIGIGLERPAEWPAQPAGNTDAQLFALRRLLQQLDRRYRLDPDAILLWSSFAGSDPGTLDGLPLEVLRESLS